MAYKLVKEDKPAGVYDPAAETNTGIDTESKKKVSDLEDEEATNAAYSKVASATSQAAQNQSGGNAEMTAGTSMMAAAPATGPAAPYLLGAGAALTTYGAIVKKEDEEANAEYLAKLKKIENAQNSLAQLMNVSQGLRSL